MRHHILTILILFSSSCYSQTLVSNRDKIETAKKELNTAMSTFSSCIVNSDLDNCIATLIKSADNEYKKYVVGGLLYEIDKDKSNESYFTLNHLKVFPNPASTHIFIEYGNYSGMNGCELKIVNSIGQTVLTNPINQQTSYIDLSTWSSKGIYYVQLMDPEKNTIECRKIIIQ